MTTQVKVAEPEGTPQRSAPPSRASDRHNGVIVVHPGTQHSYETALALQEADLLLYYLTGFYYKPASALAHAMRLLPNGRRAKLERELSRRYKPGLTPGNIRTLPLLELLYVGSSRLGPLRWLSEALLRWRNERFDRRIAQRLAQEMPAALVCYDTCAQRAFEKAKSLGIRCVLDQSIGHIRTALALYREEARLHPDFADSLPTRIPEELVERCTQEALLADCILSPSDYVRQTLMAIGVEAFRIVSLPYGVDVEKFSPAPKRAWRKFRVLFVGQLGQRKGIKYLLEAFRALRFPDTELFLVGSVVGSGEGLRPYSHLYTWVPHIPHAETPRWFQQVDLFVYPSLHEGSALSIFEALASGLPVITTPNSGSVVQDGIEGFIVPIRNVEALKEKIALLYENKELREEMSRQARKRAEEFTWANYRQRVSGLILQLLRANGYTGG